MHSSGAAVLNSFTLKLRSAAMPEFLRPALRPGIVHRQPAFLRRRWGELDKSNTSCPHREKCRACRRRVARLFPESAFPTPTVRLSHLDELRQRRSVEAHGECPRHRLQRSAFPGNTRRICRIRIAAFTGNGTTLPTSARIDAHDRCLSVSCYRKKRLRYAANCGSV